MVQTPEQLVSTDAERYLLIYMVAVLVIVTALVILIFIVFLKRKNKLLLDKVKREREFQETLIKTQTEIQEQTFKNLGQELHDNVGQLLSVANMQLSLVSTLTQDAVKIKVDDTKEVIIDAMNEVRDLSKSLNSEVISNFGLEQSIKNEIERLNKMNTIEASMIIEGKSKVINRKDAIILFRIIQEFLSNTIKYAEAKTVAVHLSFAENSLIIDAIDDGKGFEIEVVEKGAGLINMKDRASILNATFNLSSKLNEGTQIQIVYAV